MAGTDNGLILPVLRPANPCPQRSRRFRRSPLRSRSDEPASMRRTGAWTTPVPQFATLQAKDRIKITRCALMPPFARAARS